LFSTSKNGKEIQMQLELTDLERDLLRVALSNDIENLRAHTKHADSKMLRIYEQSIACREVLLARLQPELLTAVAVAMDVDPRLISTVSLRTPADGYEPNYVGVDPEDILPRLP
jgi:hypothetical protein